MRRLIFSLFLIQVIIVIFTPVKAQKADSDSASIIQNRYGLDPTTPLTQRVRKTSESVLEKFREAGMNPSEHKVTSEEEKIIAEAFATLPPLHQRVLKEHLRSINFLDNMPNTALTSTINFEDKFTVYDITIRAAILKQTISEWLTTKELTCYDTTHSQTNVFVIAGELNALVYVLLHETTHVVDGSLKLISEPSSSVANSFSAAFTKGIWTARTKLATSLQDSLLLANRFQSGKAMSISNARKLYQSLAKTPLLSLYSTSSTHEDLAEYLTVYHLTHKLKQPFKIVVEDKQKFVYEPFNSKLVKSRTKLLEYFYI
ncbi:hypothetical protein QNI19_09315 [Cytophagaceae bacterium DM2B3-1]|uniref:Secreted protein n=1 Tax=Xanthocytophaga flava TaxID=3048013 RepID=A0ABT7CHA4_9BACT|nr:hypothetical protein [Xanthocytophaga flavus]MDJ1493127.1 hypothetical protein [Xanthocytophaga flavus]